MFRRIGLRFAAAAAGGSVPPGGAAPPTSSTSPSSSSSTSSPTTAAAASSALMAAEIGAKLRAHPALQPVQRLSVVDASGGCGSFFNITIASPAFAGKTLMQQHRLVNAAIKSEIAAIHGFTLNTIVGTAPDATSTAEDGSGDDNAAAGELKK